jgi:AcrR family transcriptional regulator
MDSAMPAEVSFRPKGDKRQRTRAALIAAATAVIAEKGYGRLTLEEVAERAGMSRGAIYGNFKNREDLILAVVKTVWKPIVPPFQPGVTFREQMRLSGAFVYRTAVKRRPLAAGAAAFSLHVTQHEELRARLAEENARIFRQVAQGLAHAYPPESMPMAPEAFVRTVFALVNGLVAAHFADPEGYDEALFVAAFEALAG